jgi:addiction module HigA family antidote
MAPVVHPGRLLKREMVARKLSANRLSLDIGVPSGRITDILNGRRAITADTAVRLGRYFGNSARSSGWICRVNMTLAWSSGKKAPRSQGASGRRTRHEISRNPLSRRRCSCYVLCLRGEL